MTGLDENSVLIIPDEVLVEAAQEADQGFAGAVSSFRLNEELKKRARAIVKDFDVCARLQRLRDEQGIDQIIRSFEQQYGALMDSKYGRKGSPQDLQRIWFTARIHTLTACSAVGEHLTLPVALKVVLEPATDEERVRPVIGSVLAF